MGITGAWRWAEQKFIAWSGRPIPDYQLFGLLLLSFGCSIVWTYQILREEQKKLSSWVAIGVIGFLSIFGGGLVMIAEWILMFIALKLCGIPPFGFLLT